MFKKNRKENSGLNAMGIEDVIDANLSQQPSVISDVAQSVYLSRFKQRRGMLGDDEEWYTPLTQRVMETTGLPLGVAEQKAINTFLDAYNYYKKGNHNYKKIRGYQETKTDVEAYYATIDTIQRWTDPTQNYD